MRLPLRIRSNTMNLSCVCPDSLDNVWTPERSGLFCVFFDLSVRGLGVVWEKV